MSIIYGLRIGKRPFPDGPGTQPVDVLWSDQECAYVAPQAATVSQLAQDDGLWTHHFFHHRSRCDFAVSPDGRRVLSRHEPRVHPDDLFALFIEPVMRTILTRQQIVSFHGAALARDGAAILLLGESGAGKSTVAGALMRDGWTLLTDDLARLRLHDGEWLVSPGFRQLKLHARTAQLLAIDPASLRPRWTIFPRFGDAPDESMIGLDQDSFPKYVVQDEGPARETRVRALYLLGDRDSARPRIEALPPVEQLRSVVRHLTRDPAVPGAPPSSALMRSMPSILRQAPCFRAIMADTAAETIRSAPLLPWLRPADPQRSG